jgi:hypothetical protein
MIIDKIHDDIYNKIDNLLSNNLPPLFFDDSSIGLYEYWGSKEVDPPHPYVEIDEDERILVIDVDYPIDQVKEALDEIDKDFILNLIDDYWDLSYNYKIKDIIITDSGMVEVYIKWINVNT